MENQLKIDVIACCIALFEQRMKERYTAKISSMYKLGDVKKTDA